MPTLLTRPALDGALAELSALLAGDGATLRLVGVDETTGVVRLALELEGADCADCVLPPDRLREVVHARLRDAVPGFSALVLDDPRAPGAAGAVPAPAGAAVTGAAATVRVLDPTGGVLPGDPDPGPDAGPLAGRRVGFRVDVLWPAWDWTVEEWTRELERAGAVVSTWRRAQGLKGAAGEQAQAEYDAFVGGVDVVVSGLGNCGSCTSWSVHDGLNGLSRGLPTAVAVTEHFEPLARTLAADRGRPGLRLVVLPFSVHTRPEPEVRESARALFPRLLEVLGAEVG